jgi:multidrug efflux system outer membrane protein
VKAALLGIAALLATAGCAQRGAPPSGGPPTTLPAAYGGPTTSDLAAREAAAGGAPAVAPLPEATLDDWRSLYREPGLAALIDQALTGSRDLQLAAARVLEARALMQIADVAWLPSANVAAGASRARQSQSTGNLPPGAAAERTQIAASLGLGYEIDLWGRLRALSSAAKADLAALEQSRRAVELGVVATAAAGWFTLVELDEEARILERSLELQRRFLELTRARRDGGAASGLDVAQASAAVEQTVAQQIDVERRRRQGEHALNALAGRTGGAIGRDAGASVAADGAPPPGLPSSLLQRRPDVRAGEAGLLAAQQRVEAARAALFPAITLTAAAGGASSQLGDLFSAPARTWSFGLNLLQPLIDAQRNRFQVEAARARSEQALAGYHRTVEQAFREVADALVAKEAALAAGAARERQVAALQAAERSATARYRGGLASYFEVVDAQRTLLAGELARSQARLASRLATVELYRALGGGWQPDGPATASRAAALR